MISYELSIGLAIMTMVVFAGTMQISEIVDVRPTAGSSLRDTFPRSSLS